MSTSVNSILLQVVLISVAILTSSFVVLNYPEPKPPEPDLLPFHAITIETWTHDKNIGERFVTTPTSGINIVFYFWNDIGATDSIAVTGTTNGTGQVTVLVEEGTYDLKIGILRCGNLYGPGDFNTGRLINGLIHTQFIMLIFQIMKIYLLILIVKKI